MSLKKVSTKKLFYKKYPYRITCNVRGCWIIRNFGWDKAREYSLTGHWKYSSWKPSIDLDILYKLIETIYPIQSKAKFRFEHDFFDSYLETEEEFKQFQEILQPWIVGLSEPENQVALDFLTEKQNEKKTICKKLPHGRYKYKVHLRFNVDIDLRNNFLNWAANYNDKIRIPNQTHSWFERDNHRWPYSPAFYVEDQGTLSMVRLFLSSAVTKVEEFIPKMDINTTL